MQAIAAGQLSYIYCGKGLTVNSGDDVVLMYEPISNHGDGITVLFADAHVDWLKKGLASTQVAFPIKIAGPV